MNCPICSTMLSVKEYESVQVDVCSSCGGVWTDSGELRQIVDIQEQQFNPDKIIETFKNRWSPSQTSKKAICPKCAQDLQSFNYADTGITLDRCPSGHGIWLDADELEKVQIIMEEYDRRFSPTVSATDNSLKNVVRRCPRCEKLLHEITYEDEAIDLCGSCHGIWLDSGELQQILRKREERFSDNLQNSVVVDEAKIVPEHELLPELPCIICKEKMNRSNYSYSSGIIIDSCPHKHGIWLDEGELEKLQVLVEKAEEGLDELTEKFSGKLQTIKTECELKQDKMLDSIQPSRFNLINRFMQGLAKKGLF